MNCFLINIPGKHRFYEYRTIDGVFNFILRAGYNCNIYCDIMSDKITTPVEFIKLHCNEVKPGFYRYITYYNIKNVVGHKFILKSGKYAYDFNLN